MKVAIIGAGISGISAGQILQEGGHEVAVYEKASKPGGLVRCDRIHNHLFHVTGGHVFNAKDQVVNDWFWKRFDKEKEFIKTKRNARILFEGKLIGYPIENFLYMLDKTIVKKVLSEILTLQACGYRDPLSYTDFASFLQGNFGETLYQLYFKPYNEKLWHCDLQQVPLAWLEGKLPMPNYIELLLSNIIKEEESGMVHSTFYYPRDDGSQFIIDRLSEGLHISCNKSIDHIKFQNNKWIINDHVFDRIVYTGDVRKLHQVLVIEDHDLIKRLTQAALLKSNGTSNVLCETDETDVSWLYLPGADTRAHRIIYTGNFSASNNAPGGRKSCVVEFSGKVSEIEMKKELQNLPGNLTALAFNHEPNSYIIHDHTTHDLIRGIKSQLEPLGFFLNGRFAEWEYYNMDKAILSSLEQFAR